MYSYLVKHGLEGEKSLSKPTLMEWIVLVPDTRRIPTYIEHIVHKGHE